MKGEVWLFKDDLALRIVGLDIWADVGEAMAEQLNARMAEPQRKDGFAYVFVPRPVRRQTKEG